MENPVIIFGAGTLGREALDIFTNNNVTVYCFLDDDQSLHGSEINEIGVLGSTEDEGYLNLLGQKCEAFIASDEVVYRQSLVEMLIETRQVMPVNAVHHSAQISESSRIGHGNLVSAGVVINADVETGNHCLLFSGAVINTSVRLKDYVNVGAGSIIGAGAEIGDEVFIGTGAVIVPGVKVGAGARIGAGSVVTGHIGEGETVFGNPAKKIESVG